MINVRKSEEIMKFILNKIEAKSGVKVSTVGHIKLWNEMVGRIADFRQECMDEYARKVRCREVAE